MKDLTLEINGESVGCPPGTSILEAALEHGINIPHLCHHPDLKPFGACRLCLVEDAKTGRITASCVTPAVQDMKVLTDSPRIVRHRRNIVRLMMAEHPESCIVCSKGNRCKLREIAAKLGLGYSGLYPMPNYRKIEQANPFIIRDLSKCILCGKCIRADMELVVVGAIDFNSRGFTSRPATLFDKGLERSNCTFCGTCVSICPTGALSVKHKGYAGTPERESLSICSFCSVGCSIRLGETSGQIVEVNPSHLRQSVNGATLCIRGHFAHDFLGTTKRLAHPRIREGNVWVETPWDEALEKVGGRLTEIKKNYGPQSIGLLGSSRCTNEENYLLQKMARVLLGTNNVDSGCASYGSRAALMRLETVTGQACRIFHMRPLEDAECIFVLGSNPTHSVPVAGYSIKRAAQKGIPVIVVDPRFTEIASFASLWLPVGPNGDLELINRIAGIMLKRQVQDTSFIRDHTDGFDRFSEELSELDPNDSRGMNGREMDRAVDLLEGKKATFVVGNGILKQMRAPQVIDALLNLCLLTGSAVQRNGGILTVLTENNAMGAWDMGMTPDCLPGNDPVSDREARGKWERSWGINLSPDPGIDILKMVEEAEKGHLKALYIMGENPLRSLPHHERVRTALEKLEFIVLQDILENETSHIAHVLLPGAPFSEKSGSFTNMEGRVQFFHQAAPCRGKAMADWEILDLLGVKLGYPRGYGSLQSIRSEISRFVPLYEGIGNPEAYLNRKWGGLRKSRAPEKGQPIPFCPVVSHEAPTVDGEYPFTALIGTTRYHSGGGTRTGLSGRILDFSPKGEIELSPFDGESLGVREGEAIRMKSRLGSIVRECKLNKGLKPGLAFVPLGFNGNDAMNLISLERPLKNNGDDFKQCAVTIERV